MAKKKPVRKKKEEPTKIRLAVNMRYVGGKGTTWEDSELVLKYVETSSDRPFNAKYFGYLLPSGHWYVFESEEFVNFVLKDV